MGETVKNALAEIEDVIVNAMNTCKDEYEVCAVLMGIAAGWEDLAERASKRWIPKQETTLGEPSF